MQKFLTTLKGPHTEFHWKVIGKLFSTHLIASEMWSKIKKSPHRFFLIPAPRKGSRPDHSYYFSKALSVELNMEFMDCLTYGTERLLKDASQKDKNKYERSLIEFECTEKFARNDKSFYIFVDDVVTTGNTAAAAYFALGCPEFFVVFSLAHRPLLVKAVQL